MRTTHDGPPASGRGRSPGEWWTGIPLYLRILGGLVAGVLVGVLLRMLAGEEGAAGSARWLEQPSKLILRILGALAPPLVLVAIVHALMTAEIRGNKALRLVGLLILNTLVAISVGLLVANVLQPGRAARLEPPPQKRLVDRAETPEERGVLEVMEKFRFTPGAEKKDELTQFLENVPDSLLRPLVETNKVIGVIFVALAFGVALRRFRHREVRTVEEIVQLLFDTLLVILHWIIQLVPLGVFGIVAAIIAKEGFAPFASLAMFILAVLTALGLQATYYLVRIRFGSWVCPLTMLRDVRDALVMAFSTASSTATMPVTFACLRDRVRLREQSASLGSLVGANFNNDGTALYEAMSALFIAQLIGQDLPLPQQILVVLTSVAASVGAAGIPEAGLVTMTMVFHAVGLPTEYIAVLLAVDWFLDRCRTTINVLGDINVSCLLDGRTPAVPEGDPTDRGDVT